MNIRVIAAGKPALAFAKAGVEEYAGRLARGGGFELVTVRAGSSAEVSGRLLQRSEGCHRIAMDERGDMPGTRELHRQITRLADRGDIRTLAFLIGAADGHTEELRTRCNGLMALSRMTLQHEIALLVLLEQLYRVASIRAGSPYHRD